MVGYLNDLTEQGPTNDVGEGQGSDPKKKKKKTWGGTITVQEQKPLASNEANLNKGTKIYAKNQGSLGQSIGDLCLILRSGFPVLRW